ncbi:fungal hydrophobin-domain-containing protein [Dichomitus squalens]|uniref:Hydrophobin n=1 Tax=Dichomitus squalens TaxID=114155 RepID=A0A4Q9MD06_9APHY|nr:fungal hydrophobin-domain-containing protein [Dichomitus squalens]
MFSKLAITAAIAGLLAVATALPTPTDGGSAGMCNTGPVQCCNSVGSTTDSSFTSGLGEFLQLALKDITADIGVQCSPITAIGGSLTSTCDAHPVCCENNSKGGLINIGCIPITL